MRRRTTPRREPRRLSDSLGGRRRAPRHAGQMHRGAGRRRRGHHRSRGARPARGQPGRRDRRRQRRRRQAAGARRARRPEDRRGAEDGGCRLLRLRGRGSDPDAQRRAARWRWRSIRSTAPPTSTPTFRSARSSRCSRRARPARPPASSVPATSSLPAAMSSMARMWRWCSRWARASPISCSIPSTRRFKLVADGVKITPSTREYAINASNYRHWIPPIRTFIDDCVEGAQGPHGKDFNMRWVASLVAETHRIFVRGGVFLYPADERRGYEQGRLRLLYEANPIAFLVEQAGGGATDGFNSHPRQAGDHPAPAHAADLRLGREGQPHRLLLHQRPLREHAFTPVRPTRPVSRLRIGITNVDPASHHFRRRLLGRGHLHRQAHVRRHLPPRGLRRRLHRGRRLPPLQPRRHEGRNGQSQGGGRRHLQPFLRRGQPARRTRRLAEDLWRNRQVQVAHLCP